MSDERNGLKWLAVEICEGEEESHIVHQTIEFFSQSEDELVGLFGLFAEAMARNSLKKPA